jgi:hypothetical protein
MTVEIFKFIGDLFANYIIHVADYTCIMFANRLANICSIANKLEN